VFCNTDSGLPQITMMRKFNHYIIALKTCSCVCRSSSDDASHKPRAKHAQGSARSGALDNCTRTFPSEVRLSACILRYYLTQLSSASTPLLHSNSSSKAGCPFCNFETLFSIPALDQTSDHASSLHARITQVSKLHSPHYELQKLLFQTDKA
jgi:hypothetical protein